MIRPDGTVVDRTELFTPDALVAEIPLRTTLAVATRLGAIPELIMVIGALTGLSAALVGRVKRPHRRGSVSGEARRAARAGLPGIRPSRGRVP